MTALPRLLDAGSVSQNVTEEIGHQKLAAQYIRRVIQEADEANLIDDEELCKSLSSREEISPELDGPAVNRKPPRKERKSLLKPATSARELKKFEAVDSDDIVASESHVDEKIQMSPSAEAKRNMHLNSTHTMNGSRLNPYDMHCSEDATKGSLKPLKRTAAENPSNPGTKNLCKTAAEVRPYVPAPLATKIYYSQRSHHLRSAIRHMFFEEPSKEVSNIEVLQVNAVPTQTPDPCNFYNEQVANQQRDDHYSHLAQTPDQILAARSVNYVGKSGGLVPSMNTASQLPETLCSRAMEVFQFYRTPEGEFCFGKAGDMPRD
ncbi:hypothetical protein DH2020_048921 [Rehmannia glutinosa]|uniref:Uncharacterized protein n=1 Tax=Rehmannia glutinosa TaxID=99300 RepID=A0ABR0U576_REHGL